MRTNPVELKETIDSNESAPFHIGDMLSATFYATSVNQIISIYEDLTIGWDLEIVKIQNYIKAPIRTVILHFVFCKSILCEIRLDYGQKPPNFEAHQFLQRLSLAESPQ